MSGNKAGRGFTLLEVLAALVLLGLGCTLLYTGLILADRGEEKAAAEITGLILARMKLAAFEAGEETGRWGDFPGMAGYRWWAEEYPGEEEGTDYLIITVEDPYGRRTAVQAVVSCGP